MQLRPARCEWESQASPRWSGSGSCRVAAPSSDSTPAEAARLWWDITWIWGPPEDHLQTLLATVGASRFVLGTGQPLRLPENAGAKLDLLDLAAADRTAIERGNAQALAAPSPGGRDAG